MRSPRREETSHWLTICGSAVSCVLLAGGAFLTAQSAGAITVPGTEGGRLSLEADNVAARWDDMQPGDSVDWQIWPVLSGEAEADLSVEVVRDGDLVQSTDGLQLELRSCAVPWQPAQSAVPTDPQECQGGFGEIVVSAPMSTIPQNATFRLGRMKTGPGPYLLATLSLPATISFTPDQQANGWSGDFAFGFTAAGEVATVSPSGALASTGLDPGGPILFGAGTLLGGGMLGLSRLAGRRARS